MLSAARTLFKGCPAQGAIVYGSDMNKGIISADADRGFAFYVVLSDDRAPSRTNDVKVNVALIAVQNSRTADPSTVQSIFYSDISCSKLTDMSITSKSTFDQSDDAKLNKDIQSWRNKFPEALKVEGDDSDATIKGFLQNLYATANNAIAKNPSDINWSDEQNFSDFVDKQLAMHQQPSTEGGRRSRKSSPKSTPKSSSKSPAKSAKPSAAKGPQPTDERVLVKGRTRVVYKGPKGGKYIKKDGKFVRL